ncbi:unnamed protein product, partial [Polarella glacialis]
VASGLLDPTGPARTAASALNALRLPRAAPMYTSTAAAAVATLPLSAAAALETAAVAEVVVAGAGAGAVTGAGAMASLVLPQVLGAAVSAYGCYVIGQKVGQLSAQLRDHSDQVGGSLVDLGEGVRSVSLELRDAGQALAAGLSDLASLLRQQRTEDFVIRTRVAQQQLADDMAVLLERPSAAKRQAVREGARELRKAVGELLEVCSRMLE